MATAIRCNGCGAWMPDDQPACENCGQERPEHNPALRKAQLDEHLYKMAEGTQNEGKNLRESQKEEIRQAKRLRIEPVLERDTGLTAEERKRLGQ